MAKFWETFLLNSGHETRFLKMLEVLISPRKGSSVIDLNIWQEVHEINEFLTQKLVVTRGERNIRFAHGITFIDINSC